MPKALPAEGTHRSNRTAIGRGTASPPFVAVWFLRPQISPSELGKVYQGGSITQKCISNLVLQQPAFSIRYSQQVLKKLPRSTLILRTWLVYVERGPKVSTGLLSCRNLGRRPPLAEALTVLGT